MNKPSPKRFPRGPRLDESPFHDEQGNNRFADKADTPESGSDSDPFAASVHERPYQEFGFETTYRSMSGLWLTLAIMGLLADIAAFVNPLFAACGAVFSLIAVLRGRSELLAMQAQAMQPRGRAADRWAVGLGLLGLLFVVGFFLATSLSWW